MTRRDLLFLGCGILLGLALIGPLSASDEGRIPKGLGWKRFVPKELTFVAQAQADNEEYLRSVQTAGGIRTAHFAAGTLACNEVVAYGAMSTRRLVVMGVDMRLFSENLLYALVETGALTKDAAMEVLEHSTHKIGVPDPVLK